MNTQHGENPHHFRKKFESGVAFGRGITSNDMRRLEDSFQNPQSERHYRDRALFLVMSRSGLRASEIVNLKWSDAIDTPEGGLAFQYRKKGGKIGFTAPGIEAIHAVKEYHGAAGIVSDAFFLSLPSRVNRGNRTRLTSRSLDHLVHCWGEHLGIQTMRSRIHTHTGKPTRSLHPHSLRHTVLQKVFETMGSVAVQKIGGHSSPSTAAKFYLRPYVDASAFLQWGGANG